MSSRALRKAQQRAEEERLAALAAAPPSDNDEDDEEEEEAEMPVAAKKPNLFAMLDAELEEAAEEDEDEQSAEEQAGSKPAAASSKSKKKKNKKKKKGKAKAEDTKESAQTEGDEDFDSLLAQALKSSSISTNPTQATPSTASPTSQLHSLLHIDHRHLDLENEMRKLFGRAATSRESGAEPRQQQPRGQRLPGGRSLLAAGGRRNVFVQPNENWPREGSGGLSMDLVEKNPDDGTVLFKYAHSRVYQDIQRQFNECVRSMDPERMINHLNNFPYHISTLLQTSQIALTHNNDPTSSQALISRALFALGRSSHSVFPTSLASGIARISFLHFENRELYFAGWKYILSLSRRGLWRTGLEFIRLLLQLEPLDDPLCLILVIDQYALKSRVPQLLLDLASTPLLQEKWSNSPNILYSLSLAEFMAGNTTTAKERLSASVKRYPWMLTKLHGSLSVENIGGRSLPEGLWGQLPPSDIDNLLAEMYTLRMGDLWNIPEHARFLMDTIESVRKLDGKGVESGVGSAAYYYIGEKQRDLARHVFLMDQREGRGLIGFLPRGLRDDQGYAWDVLPPMGGESSYQKELEGLAAGGEGGSGIGVGGGNIFEVFLRSLMPSFQAPPPQTQGENNGQRGGEGSFEVDEENLRNTLIEMVEEGVGYPDGMGEQERAQLALNVGLVPRELQAWFGERFGVTVADVPEAQETLAQEEQQEEVVEEEEAEEERERDSRAIDRLVQILGTGDRSTLRIRVDRMFEGQGEEMAEVRRRVEERLGLR
ncbi:hypothetical protein TWF694_005864 [Orbilia ellipsospora]|uniref:Nulp1-pending protein n=1 Tax=Orbilia ellipsospora TaxID=2528407 RepID=A0AAV9WS54_9PEZI